MHPKKSVPDALHDALFGQPEPSEAERAALSDAPPPLVTYAVLDAAKMPYLLTSLLDSSGLRYQSLFQGAAQEELGEHAPYLVELKDGHDFTRRLFTGPDGVGGLWDKELGIFIRSRAGFDALRKHLRKFTRVQDEDGKWFYFRFWEKSVWAAVLSDEGLGKHPIAVGFLAKLILLVPKVDCRDAFLSLRYSKDFKPEVRAPVLDRHLQSALNAEIDRLNELGEIKAALSGEALGHMTAEDRYEMMKSLRFWLIEIGFGQSDQRLTAMRLLIDKGLLQGNPWPQSLQQMLADPSRGIGVRLWLLENKDWM
ncbi:DUF4123 domain-containing protein [Roseinatronobacter monicus]|uniref:DUF4123 domain-containing protein n=1 Tax=Roseinatronobacter monicus TaxID=393481 RepID=UPI001476E82F|nr:DUF4123 domain-containing protein [Roseinatronobacter monicus]